MIRTAVLRDEGIGQRVKCLRKRQGLTQQQLADLSGLGIMAISDIERGQSNPKVGTLERIAKALRVPLSKFFDTPN